MGWQVGSKTEKVLYATPIRYERGNVDWSVSNIYCHYWFQLKNERELVELKFPANLYVWDELLNQSLVLIVVNSDNYVTDILTKKV